MSFKRKPLADCVPELVATARGDQKATLVITGGKLVNVVSGEILEGMNVAVQGGASPMSGRISLIPLERTRRLLMQPANISHPDCLTATAILKARS